MKNEKQKHLNTTNYTHNQRNNMEYRCFKCNHKWKGRKKTKPQECPNCKNRNWEKEKK